MTTTENNLKKNVDIVDELLDNAFVLSYEWLDTNKKRKTFFVKK